jgi:hypothetical protein
LTSHSADAETHEDFLVFDCDVQSSNATNANIAIAFSLESPKDTEQPRIVGMSSSPLGVFFPTKIETKLKFLIQGPYHTTPTRETIHEDDDWNRKLIERTAFLVADKLPVIRDMGLLTPGFLETLPIRSSDFPDGSLFRPLFERVRVVLAEQSVLPAHDRQFVSAKNAKLASSAGLGELLTDDQLACLHRSNAPLRWLSEDIPCDWDQRGVGLSATQFRKAQELGEQFWLYVVERAEQSDFAIHPIQNPAYLAKQFFFDSGWKTLANLSQQAERGAEWTQDQ